MMIYTVTLNPSIDYVMYVEDFQNGALNRAQRTQKYAGGKGINVSRVLQTLNVTSTALGFIGGQTGEMIQTTLKTSGIQTALTKVDEDTRINVKLKGNQETEINASGPNVNEAQLEELLSHIKETSSEDVIILAGSIPSSLPTETYAYIAAIAQQTKARIVVDAEKNLVDTILQYRPLLIKPNQKELEMMFDVTIRDTQDVVYYAQQLIQRGAEAVLVSLGGEGAVYVDEQHALKINAPQGQPINTVGSGDSTVAGFMAGLTMEKSLEDTLKLAIACGSATAFNEDLAEFNTITQLQNQINVVPIQEEG